MTKSDGLITAYILDGEHSGQKIGWDEINSWSASKGTIWIHLDFTSHGARQWLKKKSGIEKVYVESLIAEETRPRSLISPQGLLVFLRGVNLNPGKDPEDMVSIRTWIDENRIITTRHQKLLSIDDLETAIHEGKGPTTPSELLIMLNDFLLDRIGDSLDTLETEIDELEQEILSAYTAELRPKIADCRRQAIVIRRYLSPQREALYRLQIEDTKWLSNEDKVHLREGNDRIIRYIEDLDSMRERSAITQEELSTRLGEQINQRTYALTVVAIIFLPLTFITGLLGINVDGIPGAKYHAAFGVVCLILLGISIGLYAILKRFKWM